MTEGQGPSGAPKEETDLLSADLTPQPPTNPPPPPPGYGPPPPAYPQQGPPGFPGQGYPQGYPPGQYPPPGYGQPAYGYAGGPGYYQPRRRGTGTGLKVFLLLMFLLLVGFIGLILAFVGGVIKFTDIQRLIGQGPAVIYVDNMRESGDVLISMKRIDVQGEVASSYDDTIAAADFRTYPDRQPGAWNLSFTDPDGTSLGTCHLRVAGNGEYTFVVLQDVIAVTQTGRQPTRGEDLVMDTSALCMLPGI